MLKDLKRLGSLRVENLKNQLVGNRAVLLVFVVSFCYLLIMVAPDNTWINTNSDGSTYLTSARYFVLSHPTGAPLFNLTNYVLVRLPGNDFWNISMGAALATSVAAAFLYLTSVKLFNAKVLNYLPPLIYVTSSLVISQSTVAESYPLVTMFIVIMYYLHITGRGRLKYVAGGLGIAVHPIILFTIAPIWLSDWWNSGKDLKTGLKQVAWCLVGAPFYLYLIFANDGSLHWIGGNGIWDYKNYFTSQTGLTGGIAIFDRDMAVRLMDFFLIIVGSLSIFIIPVIFSLYDKLGVKDFLLPSLFLIPIIYYITNLAPQTYVYMMPSIAFGSILAVYGLKGFFKSLPKIQKYSIHASYMAILVMAVFNLFFYDIGVNLDPKLTANEFYQQLRTLPKNATVWSETRGWETVTIWLYNRDNPNRDIQSMTIGSIKEYEVTLEDVQEIHDQGLLYTTIVYDTKTYGVVVLPMSSVSDIVFDWENNRPMPVED